jgi:succinoglycan biosynthesis protein ExoA
VTPRISVVIPCRNEAACIESTLASILSQEPPEGGFEIIVADGMSEDGTRDILTRMAKENGTLRVVDNPRQVVSTGLNHAIGVARGRIIVRMDAHTEYASDYLRRCVETVEETSADNVGGPWIARGTTFLARAIAAAFQSPFATGGAPGHTVDYKGLVDTVYLGCWPVESFAKYGLFDEELVRNQDDEHNLRITRAGGKVWQSPRIRSWYTPRGALRALFRQYYQYGYWNVRVIQKHRLPAAPRHLAPGVFALGILLGWLAGFVHWVFGIAYLAAILCYLLLDLAFSIIAARRAGWDLLPVLPLVFVIYHVSYGLGFLQGIADFAILRRGGRLRSLTR